MQSDGFGEDGKAELEGGHVFVTSDRHARIGIIGNTLSDDEFAGVFKSDDEVDVTLKLNFGSYPGKFFGRV